MVRDPHLAEDVTQSAFVALAQNAAQLSDRPVLSGCLHRTAQNLASKTVRSDVRRRAREQDAANNGKEPTDPSQILPYLASPEQQAAYQTLLQRRATNAASQ